MTRAPARSTTCWSPTSRRPRRCFGRGRAARRIDLIVADDEAGRRCSPASRAALPPGAELVAAGAQAGTTAQMIRAFQLNLTALSLLALVVGMFLIYKR